MDSHYNVINICSVDQTHINLFLFNLNSLGKSGSLQPLLVVLILFLRNCNGCLLAYALKCVLAEGFLGKLGALDGDGL